MSGKRKFMVFLVLVVALMLSNLASAADPVAIIVDFEKVEDGLSIERASSDSGGKTALLYPSDKISGSNLSQVTVRCGPYAKCVSVGDGVFQVVYDPPSVITSVTEAVVNRYFGYWNSVEDFYLGSSRGAVQEPVLEVSHKNLAPAQKMIWQAAFLQVLSDSYPKKYDLYWLSGQLARQVRDKNLMGRKNLILTKCQQHLMPAYK